MMSFNPNEPQPQARAHEAVAARANIELARIEAELAKTRIDAAARVALGNVVTRGGESLTAQALLERLAKPGYKTSEFWLSALALALAGGLPWMDRAIEQAGEHLHNSYGAAGAVAAAVVAAGYSIARGYARGKAGAALLTGVLPPVELPPSALDSPLDPHPPRE